MTKLEIALMIVTAIWSILVLLKLIEVIALMSIRRTLELLHVCASIWHVEWKRMQKPAENIKKEKPPDADPQAHADEKSRAPMVRMAAETLRRRRSEALE